MQIKRYSIKINETIATVISEEKFISFAEKEILYQRKQLENYIKIDPIFKTILKPYEVIHDAPEIVKRMANAGAKVGVGPMASVAGAIAEYAVKAMINAGARHAIVDNGGDIAMYISCPVIVGIFSGEKGVNNLGLKFRPQKSIIGVCTSSATVGPSLSFGKADSATVISKDVILADATATALCNSITQKDQRLIEKSINSLWVDCIDGMIVIIEDLVGMGGDLPEIVRVSIDYDLITKG